MVNTQTDKNSFAVCLHIRLFLFPFIYFLFYFFFVLRWTKLLIPVVRFIRTS